MTLPCLSCERQTTKNKPSRYSYPTYNTPTEKQTLPIFLFSSIFYQPPPLSTFLSSSLLTNKEDSRRYSFSTDKQRKRRIHRTL